MSQEVFELVKGMDLKDIETQLAMQCAPVIMGLKISNLLIIPSENADKVRKILNGTNLSILILLVKEEKMTMLVYRSDRLKEYLSEGTVKELLAELGYQEPELSALIPVFKKRYAAYWKNGGSFPHEMGVLLGYPIEDVRGFIKNEGRNFLYTGYWKVYENIGDKLCLFRQFELAKETLIQLIARGISMSDVIKESHQILE